MNRNALAAIIFLFVFGFLSIFGFLLLNSIVTEMETVPGIDPQVTEVGHKFLNNMKLFDKVTFLMAIVFIIGIGVTSYQIASPAIYFIITFLTAGFYGFISYFFNYIFQELVSHTVFTATLLYFPLTVLICRNLHWVMLAMVIVGSITLYAKRGEKGQFLA